MGDDRDELSAPLVQVRVPSTGPRPVIGRPVAPRPAQLRPGPRHSTHNSLFSHHHSKSKQIRLRTATDLHLYGKPAGHWHRRALCAWRSLNPTVTRSTVKCVGT